jgi:1-acyl-sn-glycerol-3-phosphate acyltransferase
VFYWLLKRVFLGPLLRALFRPWVKGLEHVPDTGGAILASNHLSFSDSFFLPLMVPRRVTFLAKSDYFTGRGIKGRLTAGFFRGAGQLPVDRSGGRASDAALLTGLKVLGSGGLLGIYPEGTRSPDGRLYRGKTGVARMALEARVPVLPVSMVGTAKVQPIGRVIPKLGRIGVVIGEPLDFSRYEGMHEDRFILRSVTDEIMYELMQLSGQEYVDVYASTMKERLAAARRPRGGQAPAGIASESDDPLDDALDDALDDLTEGAVDGGVEGEAVDAAPAEVVDGVAGVIADVPEGGPDRLDGEAKAEVRGDAPDGASRP